MYIVWFHDGDGQWSVALETEDRQAAFDEAADLRRWGNTVRVDYRNEG